MTYLITQMLLCLLLAALFGFLIGWALGALICRKKIGELEASCEDRLAIAVAAARPAHRDDLKKIEGVGPKIESLLFEDGILTWEQLAGTPVERIKGILHRAGAQFQIHDPASWPDQAKLAAEGRWKDLEELQDILLGGRGI
ncbi:MAG: hypothetical protein ABFS37_13970 [Acidobacteriota bacterium]